MKFLQWLLLLVTLTTIPSVAAAQEIILNGPLLRSCTLQLIREATPARWEWVYWASGGWRLHSTGGNILGGIGAEATTGLLTYSGFPSGDYGPRLGRAELRFGPWLQAQADQNGDAIEGGIKLHLGATYHASLGIYDIRSGLGYGAFPQNRQPYASVTFAYGVRSALSRYSGHGACAPAPAARDLAMASVARLFITYRESLSMASAHEIVFGLELSPTFLLPPYNWFRLGGGPPRY